MFAPQPFPMSPRNSPEAVVNMLEKTSAHRLIADKSTAGLTSAIVSQLSEKNYQLEVDELPPFPQIYPSLKATNGPIPPVTPYPTKDNTGLNDLALLLHSSGSTGFPKPIPSTRRIATQWVNAGLSMFSSLDSLSHCHNFSGCGMRATFPLQTSSIFSPNVSRIWLCSSSLHTTCLQRSRWYIWSSLPGTTCHTDDAEHAGGREDN